MNVIFRNWVLLIILLTVMLPLSYYHEPDQGLWWDEAVYLELASNTLNGNGYWINSVGVDSFRPPVFPMLISTVWIFTGFSETAARLIPYIFALLSVIVSYVFAKELLGKETGLWTALLVGTSHFFLFYSDKILTESLFIFLSTLSLYVFYLATKKNKNLYFIAAGILISLSFLTRYAGILLFSVYILYPLYLHLKHKESVFRKWGYWAAFLVFVIILIPWLSLNITYYGSPLGGLAENTIALNGEYYYGEWYFYFANWLEIFGFVGIFAIAGILSFLRPGRSRVFLIIILLASILFFIFIPRKELRYLLHFHAIYSILIASGIVWARKVFNKWNIITIIALILVGLNLFAGINWLSGAQEDGTALKNAGIYLRAAPQNSTIMTQNMPVINHISGRTVVYFPEEMESLNTYIEENNVSYIVLQIWEPTYPGYVWSPDKEPSEVFEQFVLEMEFKEFGKPNVWVYST